MENFDPATIIEQASALVSTWGLSVLGAVAVLIIGLFVAKLVRHWTRKALLRTKLDETLVPFLASLVYYGLVAFILIAVLGLFGIPTTSFIAVLGAAGLAVGLALQGTLSNFAAGVMLLAFRPFRKGDYVEAAGQEGIVKEIGVFASVLDTLDNVSIVLPNAAIWGTTIKNFTSNPLRRNDLIIGISYGDNIARAKEIIEGVLRSDPRVVNEPESLVAVSGLGDSSVDLLVAPWCAPADYWTLRFDLYEKIKTALEAGGCTIPFPQRDVHMIDQSAA